MRSTAVAAAYLERCHGGLEELYLRNRALGHIVRSHLRRAEHTGGNAHANAARNACGGIATLCRSDA